MSKHWQRFLRALGVYALWLIVSIDVAGIYALAALRKLWGGEVPYALRAVLLLVLIVVGLTIGSWIINKPYKELQEARKSRTE